jgi:hypothetical protein
MMEAERTALKERIAAWERAAPVLQELRDEDIREADTISAIESMTLLFRDAVKNFPPEPTSGLVEQQRWFAKLRRS